MSELPEILDAEAVARLTGLNVEWVWAKRGDLPCTAGHEPFEVTVERRDLPAWFEAARARVERHETRRTPQTPDVDLAPREGLAVHTGDGTYAIAWKR